MKKTALFMAVVTLLYGKGLMCSVQAAALPPTPISYEESLLLRQQESLTYAQVEDITAGEDNSDGALVAAFAAIGIIALIGALIAASQDDEEDQ